MAETTERIKTAFERTETALKKRPSLGQKTGKVTVRSTEGLTCEIENKGWKFKADMPVQMGGNETAPTPGTYEAAALGSCVTILVNMWAAKLDVPVNTVETEVTFEADTSCLFNVNNVPARWQSIRYHIRVESTAPEADVMRVLDAAHNQSHVRGDFEHPFTVGREVTITKPALK